MWKASSYLAADFYLEMSQNYEAILCDAALPEISSLVKNIKYPVVMADDRFRTPWECVKPDNFCFKEEAGKISELIMALCSNLPPPRELDISCFGEDSLSHDDLLTTTTKGESFKEINTDIIKEQLLVYDSFILEEPILTNYLPDGLFNMPSAVKLKEKLITLVLEDPFESSTKKPVTIKGLRVLQDPIQEIEVCEKYMNGENYVEFKLPEFNLGDLNKVLSKVVSHDCKENTITNCSGDSILLNIEDTREQQCIKNITLFNVEDNSEACELDKIEMNYSDNTFGNTEINYGVLELNKEINCLENEHCQQNTKGKQGQNENLILVNNEIFEHGDKVELKNTPNNKNSDVITDVNIKVKSLQDESLKKQTVPSFQPFLEKLADLTYENICSSQNPTFSCKLEMKNNLELNGSVKATRQNMSKTTHQKLFIKSDNEIHATNTKVVVATKKSQKRMIDLDDPLSNFLTVRQEIALVKPVIPFSNHQPENYAHHRKADEIKDASLANSKMKKNISDYSKLDTEAEPNINLTFESEVLDIKLSDAYVEAVKAIEIFATPLLKKLLSSDKFNIPLHHTLINISSDTTRFMLNQEIKLCQDSLVNPTNGGIEQSFYCQVLALHGLVKSLECLIHFDLCSAVMGLKDFESSHCLLLKGFYHLLIDDLTRIQCSIYEKCIMHPKLAELCSYLWKKYTIFQNNQMDFKVLLIVRRYIQILYPLLKSAAEGMLKEITVFIIPENAHLKNVPDAFRYASNLILVASSSSITEDIPWHQLSLVVEYEHNDNSIWKNTCLQNAILHSSVKMSCLNCKSLKDIKILPCFSKDKEVSVSCDSFLEGLEGIRLIGTDSITSNSELLCYLEAREGITIIERCYQTLIPHLLFADIVVDECTAVILSSFDCLRQDDSLDLLLNKSAFLSMKYEVCWIIFKTATANQNKKLPDCRTERENLWKFYATSFEISSKVTSYKLKILYASCNEEMAQLIRQVMSYSYKLSNRKEKWNQRSFLTSNVTKEEIFLLSIPCLNPFMVHFMLSVHTLEQLFNMDFKDLCNSFSFMPERQLKVFYCLVHQPLFGEMDSCNWKSHSPKCVPKKYQFDAIYHRKSPVCDLINLSEIAELGQPMRRIDTSDQMQIILYSPERDKINIKLSPVFETEPKSFSFTTTVSDDIASSRKLLFRKNNNDFLGLETDRDHLNNSSSKVNRSDDDYFCKYYSSTKEQVGPFCLSDDAKKLSKYCLTSKVFSKENIDDGDVLLKHVIAGSSSLTSDQSDLSLCTMKDFQNFSKKASSNYAQGYSYCDKELVIDDNLVSDENRASPNAMNDISSVSINTYCNSSVNKKSNFHMFKNFLNAEEISYSSSKDLKLKKAFFDISQKACSVMSQYNNKPHQMELSNSKDECDLPHSYKSVKSINVFKTASTFESRDSQYISSNLCKHNSVSVIQKNLNNKSAKASQPRELPLWIKSSHSNVGIAHPFLQASPETESPPMDMEEQCIEDFYVHYQSQMPKPGLPKQSGDLVAFKPPKKIKLGYEKVLGSNGQTHLVFQHM